MHRYRIHALRRGFTLLLFGLLAMTLPLVAPTGILRGQATQGNGGQQHEVVVACIIYGQNCHYKCRNGTDGDTGEPTSQKEVGDQRFTHCSIGKVPLGTTGGCNESNVYPQARCGIIYYYQGQGCAGIPFATEDNMKNIANSGLDCPDQKNGL